MVRYSTEREARDSRKQQLRKPGFVGRLRPYHCHKCDGWHLTSLK